MYRPPLVRVISHSPPTSGAPPFVVVADEKERAPPLTPQNHASLNCRASCAAADRESRTAKTAAIARARRSRITGNLGNGERSRQPTAAVNSCPRRRRRPKRHAPPPPSRASVPPARKAGGASSSP